MTFKIADRFLPGFFIHQWILTLPPFPHDLLVCTSTCSVSSEHWQLCQKGLVKLSRWKRKEVSPHGEDWSFGKGHVLRALQIRVIIEDNLLSYH